MSLTLVEAAKLETGDVYRRGVISMFAQSAGILEILPFTDIPGNALKYNREESLPNIGFRGVNEAYEEGTGIINPVTEALAIAGGDLDVDKFIVDTMTMNGQDQRTTQEGMKIKALALAWERTFFKGNSTGNPREFDGIQGRIIGNQLISAGTTAAGDPLSLGLLDELIDQVQNPTHLLMNKAMRRVITAAARNLTVAGAVTWTTDSFGRPIAKYNDLPIVTVGNDNLNQPIIGFNEASEGGSAEATSIYCLSLGDGGVVGLQNGGMGVRDIGELQSKPAFRTRVEWYSGIAIYDGRSAARLYGLNKNPAVV